jgi:hypothetical protein
MKDKNVSSPHILHEFYKFSNPCFTIYANECIIHLFSHLVIRNYQYEREAVQLQINLYKQMREQLIKVKLYQLQHKVELAKIIFKSKICA